MDWLLNRINISWGLRCMSPANVYVPLPRRGQPRVQLDRTGPPRNGVIGFGDLGWEEGRGGTSRSTVD